jgi:hypothetical protein
LKLITEQQRFWYSKRANNEARRKGAIKNRALRQSRKALALKKLGALSEHELRSYRIKLFSDLSAAPTEKTQSLSRRNHPISITIPKVFSIRKNPELVLNTVSQLAHWSTNKKLKSIKFDHDGCIEHDLGAEVLLAGAAADLKRRRKLAGGKLHTRGNFPKDKDMARLVHSIGVVQAIGAKSAYDGEEKKTLFFKGFGDPNEKLNVYASSQKDKVIAKLLLHINKCLFHLKYKLSADGMSQLTITIGEIIDNAEGHSGENFWYAYGYLDESNPDHLCSEIVIYNFGPSIAETLKMKIDNPDVFSQDSLDYLKRHAGHQSEENLLTVLALQQYISSKRDSKNIFRGQGLTDLLLFFNDMTAACTSAQNHSTIKPEMCIMSGNTHVTFDGTLNPTLDGDNVYRCYLNKGNDANIPPDKAFVRNLKGISFPGTLIALKFPLKDKSLVEQVDEETNND